MKTARYWRVDITCILLIISTIGLFFYHNLLYNRNRLNANQSPQTNVAILTEKFPINSLNGGVEIYTRAGCRYCRIAKAKLSELRIPYLEVDITHPKYPSHLVSLKPRYLDRLAFVRSTTVPQIYIGDEKVGGCDDLLEDIESNNLYQILNRHGIKLETKSIEGPKDFIKEDNIGFTFEFMTGEPLNVFKSIAFDSKIFSPLDLSVKLQQTALEMVDKFASKDGKSINYSNLRTSKIFKKYWLLSRQLSTLKFEEIVKLQAEHKMSLYVNVYNAFIIHAIAILGPPINNPSSRSDFFNGNTGALYNIAGKVFSPNDLEHGLIRNNRPHPSIIGKSTYFNPIDERSRLSVPYFDSRVHFILNCGAKSCPPIQILGENPSNALKLAAASYLRSEVTFISLTGTLTMPKLSLWYASDFGNTIANQVSQVVSYLDASHKQIINDDMRRFARSISPENRTLIEKEWKSKMNMNDSDIVIPLRDILNTATDIEKDGVWICVVYNAYHWEPNGFDNH